MDWFDKEMEALEQQLERGEISREQFHRERRQLQRDAQEQDDRADIIASGRGYLLRDW